MKPSQIAHLILRLFALSWLVQGVVYLSMLLIPETPWYRQWTPFTVLFVMAALAWCFAPRLGRLVAGRDDEGNALPQISHRQLLHVLVIGLGLYFCLSSAGRFISMFVVYLSASSTEIAGLGGSHITRELFSGGATFAIGMFVILAAPQLVRKLLPAT